MIPRRRLDIGFADLLYGIGHCFWPQDRARLQSRLESLWSPEADAVACLSVRSGFDLLLRALELPTGSEILVSAITIRDMVRIVEHHGLVPVPVDLDMQTLSVNPDCLAQAVTEKTKLILVAHLFGSRMPLEPILEFARRRGLLVVEDCAQAYAGNGYRGHPQSDVSMFSFGPIKTNTALGGAVLRLRDRSLRAKVKTLQAGYPVQRRRQFLARLCQYLLLKALIYPLPFGVFATLCRLAGKSHDDVIGAAVRGFAGPDFFAAIRHQPCEPLLALLERRLKNFDAASVERRMAVARAAIESMPGIARPGEKAAIHTYWVFPIQAACPDELMRHLWRGGFDATRGATSLHVVSPPPRRPQLAPVAAHQFMARVLYLPVYPGVSARDVKRLARATTRYEMKTYA